MAPWCVTSVSHGPLPVRWASVAILGLSAGFHDSAAAVVTDGRLVAAAQEERFSRLKHDPAMPAQAASWCLDAAGVADDGLEAVVFYEKPFTSYERILSTHAVVGPKGFPQLSRAVRTWTKDKLWVAASVDRLLAATGRTGVPLAYAEHHVSHAAAAYYPSPFESAAVVTVDGVGEWATSSWGTGQGNTLTLQAEVDFPDSLGLLYSTFTAYCGFAVNDGEYKLMGLAPYGEPRFVEVLRDRVVQVNDDGSVRLDQKYFDYRAGRRMASPRLHELLGGPPRRPDEDLEQRHADVARSAQALLEEALLAMVHHVHRRTGEQNLCLGGGVALNCVANSRILREGPFDQVWVQPAAGDAGSAVGAALWFHHAVQGVDRVVSAPDGMSGAALGPAFDHDEVAKWLSASGVEFDVVPDTAARAASVAAALDGGAVVGWFEGPMEFGPRALGHRSILADPRDASMVQRINALVKGREGFRPFAPAVLSSDAPTWFEMDRPSPYMLFTVPVRSASPSSPDSSPDSSFVDRLGAVRSDLPACTHVDGSARVQTVDPERSPAFAQLIEEFGRRTGCSVLLNTSFNRADEPVVRTPADALRCAALAGLDLLVLERCLVSRSALEAVATARSTL